MCPKLRWSAGLESDDHIGSYVSCRYMFALRIVPSFHPSCVLQGMMDDDHPENAKVDPAIQARLYERSLVL